MRDGGPAAEIGGDTVAVDGQSLAGAESEGSEQTWTVRNLTANRLELHGRDDAVCVLPAYGCRSMTYDPHIEFVGLGREEGRGPTRWARRLAGRTLDHMADARKTVTVVLRRQADWRASSPEFGPSL
jgi:hypothetical protein